MRVSDKLESLYQNLERGKIILIIMLAMYSLNSFAQDYYFAAVCEKCGGYLRVVDEQGDYYDNNDNIYNPSIIFGHKPNCSGSLWGVDNIMINDGTTSFRVIILGLRNYYPSSIIQDTFTFEAMVSGITDWNEETGEDIWGWIPRTISCKVIQIGDFAFKESSIRQL